MRVCPPNATSYTVQTRVLVFATDDHFELTVLCDNEKALVWINGEPAGSKGYPLADAGPLHVCLPSWAKNRDTACQEWCATVTPEAIERRRRRRLSLRTKPGRRLLAPRQYLESLKDEVVQIAHLIALIDAGARSHIHGLSARIRSVACYMKASSSIPLLQACASLADLPLPVHTPPPHWAASDNAPHIELGGRIFAVRMHSTDIELDFDVWLSLPLFRFGEVSYSNNDVIRAFAETMGGAHHDPSVDPNIEEIQEHLRIASRSPQTFGLLHGLVHEVGGVVLTLSASVLNYFERHPTCDNG
jgi:hypothetical protein